MSKELWIDPWGGGDADRSSQIFVFEGGSASLLKNYFQGIDAAVNEMIWIQKVVKEQMPTIIYIDKAAPTRHMIARRLEERSSFVDFGHWLAGRLRACGYSEQDAKDALGIMK